MSNREFDWKKYQKRLHYSDEEMEHFRADPRRANATQKLFSRDAANKCLIFPLCFNFGFVVDKLCPIK